jgi:hypothetical protein
MAASAQRTPPQAPAAAGPRGGARPMTRADIPAVSGLFARIFRGRSDGATAELEDYLDKVFFGSPLYTPETGSVVYESAEGEVASTILVVPMAFRAGERELVARLLCAFMADGKDSAVGAARLARQMRAARQDMCFSDNSSPVSASHWVAGGGAILPIQSLQWRRSFRPAAAAAIGSGRVLRCLRSRPVLALARPVDALLRRWRRSLTPVAPQGCRVEPATPDAFLACAGPMTERFHVRPVWSKPEFDWLLSVARLNRRLGELHIRTVHGPDARVIGAYLYFGRRGREATVLNLVCEAGREQEVSGAMFAALDAEGYAAAVGMAQPFLMTALFRQRWMTYRHEGHFCMVTRHAEIGAAVARDDIYIGGLASESWSRLLNDF